MLFIFLIYFISSGLIGLLFNLRFGFFLGLSISISIFILLSFFGEKIVLIFAKARYVSDDEILINQVKNFCCHCEIPEVKVYWSSVFTNNLYYTNTYFGMPALIIGRNAYKVLTRKELNSLIYASLLKLKTNEASNRTIASLIFLILYSPVYLLRSLINHKTTVNVLNIFIYPAFYFKSKLYEMHESVLRFDQQVGSFDGLRKDYMSALFKVRHFSICQEDSIGAFVFNDLNHINNQSKDALSFLLINQVSVEERVKALR